MALDTMYRAVNNSVPTVLAEGISATATSIPLANAAILPPAPGLATIGEEDNAEVILYSGIDGNTLTQCLRGRGGTVAQVWPAEATVYRAFTAMDHNTLIDNVNALETQKLDKTGAGSDVTVEFTQAAARTNVSSGLTLAGLFGRIMKWFADLKAGAFAEFGAANNQIARGDHTHIQYLTAESDPSVSAWAKQPQKPAYTHTEVGAAAASHTHTIANVTALQSALDGKAASSHTHAQADVTELSGALEGKADLAGGKVVPAQISAATMAVTGNYSLALSDAGKQIEVNAVSDVTVTIPADADVAFPVGSEIEIVQEGTGKVTIAAASGVTLNSLDDMRDIAGQYGVVALKKRGANDWRLAGGLA